MEYVTDWALLWRQVVEARLAGRDEPPEEPRVERPAGGSGGRPDPWAERAREFDVMAKARPRGAGSRQQAVLDLLEPGDTVLDIGAGTGAWAILFAGKAAGVTALDASPAMTAVLWENVAAAGPAGERIRVIEGRWPAVPVQAHDVTFCAHAMYGDPDLPAFIRRMEAVTRRRCCLVARLPSPQGLLGQAAQQIWGHPFDSPSFVIAYNVLLQMGITANVRIDGGSQLAPRTSATFDQALGRLKRHFGLGEIADHDPWLRDLLERRLVRVDGRPDGPLAWPREGGSALVWWDVAR